MSFAQHDFGCVSQVVLDLGRRPEARFAGATGGEYLRDEEASFLTCILPHLGCCCRNCRVMHVQ